MVQIQRNPIFVMKKKIDGLKPNWNQIIIIFLKQNLYRPSGKCKRTLKLTSGQLIFLVNFLFNHMRKLMFQERERNPFFFLSKTVSP